MKKWFPRLISWMTVKMGFGYLFLLHKEVGPDDHRGCTLWTEDDLDHLEAILHSSLENCPQVRNMVLGATVNYLKRYEVDCKNFLEELKKG